MGTKHTLYRATIHLFRPRNQNSDNFSALDLLQRGLLKNDQPYSCADGMLGPRKRIEKKISKRNPKKKKPPQTSDKAHSFFKVCVTFLFQGLCQVFGFFWGFFFVLLGFFLFFLSLVFFSFFELTAV